MLASGQSISPLQNLTVDQVIGEKGYTHEAKTHRGDYL